MTLATHMIFPSTYCYSFYLNLIEWERGTGIGKTPSPSDSVRKNLDCSAFWTKDPFQLVVRVTSIAHAAIQIVIAALETLPVLAISTVIVLFNGANTGFTHFEGGRLERIKVTAFSALASAWFPIATSIWIAIDPNVLNSNEIVSLPGIAQARLLSFTLPSLPKLADRLGRGIQTQLETKIVERQIAVPPDGSDGSVGLLELADTLFFQWRERLAIKLATRSKETPSYFNSHFNLLSEEFRRDLLGIVVP